MQQVCNPIQNIVSPYSYIDCITLHEKFFKIEEMENATFTMKSHYTLFIINTFDYNFFFILIIQKLLINQNTVSLAKLL